MSNIYQFLFSRQTSYSNCWIRCFDVFDNFHSPSKLYGREIRLWRRMLYSTVLHLFSDSIVCWTCMCCVGVSLQNSFVLFLNWILYRFSLEELDGTKYCIHIVAMLYLNPNYLFSLYIVIHFTSCERNQYYSHQWK